MRHMVVIASVVVLTTWAGTAQAEVVTEEVEYRHGEVVLRGYLAYDDAAEGARPGVVVVHEWWGLDDYARRRAEQLAELGYVAFAIDMYGAGVVTDNPARAAELSGQFGEDRQLGRRRAAAGLEVLANHQRVDRERIAAVGYCFGGTVALELVRDGAELVGVVSFHGSLATPAPARAGELRARVLVLHGADDPYVPPRQVMEFIEEMRAARADWQLVHYGGAKHSFTNPASDELGMEGVGYDERADERSWRHMRGFLEEVFGE